MQRSSVQFRWLAVLTLWTSLIGPVFMSPIRVVGTPPDQIEDPNGETPAPNGSFGTHGP